MHIFLKSSLLAVIVLGLLGAVQETYALPNLPAQMELPKFSQTLSISDKASCLKLPGHLWEKSWKEPNVCELYGYRWFDPDATAGTIIIEKGIHLKLKEGPNGAGILNDLILVNYGVIVNYGTIKNYNVIENYGQINLVSDTESALINYGTVHNLGPDGYIKNQELISNHGKFVNDDNIQNFNTLDVIINHGEWINTENGRITGGTIDNRFQLDNYGEILDSTTFWQFGITNNVGKITTDNLKNKIGVIYNYDEIETSVLLNKSIIRNCGNASFSYSVDSPDSDGEITSGINCPPKPTMPDIEEFTLALEYVKSGERMKQEIQTRTSDELKERMEQTFKDGRELTSELIINQLQEENKELESKVRILEKEIQSLIEIIMEQVQVMLQMLK